MNVPHGPLHYWSTILSYRAEGNPHRKSKRLGVVAPDIEAAIALAKRLYEGQDCRVFNCSHQGSVDFVEEDAATKPLRDDIIRLKGIANLLSDKLSHYCGSIQPDQLREAEQAEAAGGENWDDVRGRYVDDRGRKLEREKAREG